MDEIYRHLDTHVLFKLHWGGRGVKGDASGTPQARAEPKTLRYQVLHAAGKLVRGGRRGRLKIPPPGPGPKP